MLEKLKEHKIRQRKMKLLENFKEKILKSEIYEFNRIHIVS